MTAHFPKRKVLWIDGTGAWTEIVNGMLVASSNGTLDLLPALPDALPAGTVRGVLARGQLRIDRLTWDKPPGKLEAEITSAINQKVTEHSGACPPQKGDVPCPRIRRCA